MVLPPPLWWCSLNLLSDSPSLLTPCLPGPSGFCLWIFSHSVWFYAVSSVSLSQRSSTSSCFGICICREKRLCGFLTLVSTCLQNTSDLIAQLHLSQTTCFPPNRLSPLELWKTWKSFLPPPSPLLLWHPGNHDVLRITESWSYNNTSHRFFSLQPFFFSPGLLWQPLPNCSCSLISPPHWIQRTLLKNKEENKTTPLLTALRCLPVSWVVSPPKAVVILSLGTAECSLLGEWSS